MKRNIKKLRYFNLLLMLLLTFNSFSVTHYDYNKELPEAMQGLLYNYRIFIIILLVIEGILLFKNWLLYLNINIFGKILYILTLIFIVSVLNVCNMLSIINLKNNHPYVFTLMKKSYPFYGIIIAIVVFLILSYLSNISFGIHIFKKKGLEK